MQFDNYIKKDFSKVRSIRYVQFVSSCDIIFIFLVKAWPRSENITNTYEYHENLGEN